ncbi:TetR/AcrR family transcriptional regulator [Halomonas sp. SH5A2]|uniref:TetR/AcrR family transcriptional regulator n=1 Tax=Halomonas sp. SH5A2 TaxID=2749040 RepID=UPI001641FCE2|nr:TetR/AcrR family transcriptional regulator [Halomonas sp. SH5A2]QNI03907.1 TetR/AcrR family transcriptional regulator [Halomonas sp. SH5A2]
MPRTSIHTREESLEKALHLFWRQGYGATSLKDIEHALDMRPGSIYATFGSKEQLFSRALDCYAERAMAELEGVLSADPSPLGGLVDYIRMLGGLRARDETCQACMLVKILLEFSEREQTALPQVEDRLARMECRFIERLTVAQAVGEIAADADPRRLGRRLQADIIGLRTYAQRNVDDRAVRELAEDIAHDWEKLRQSN